MHTHTSTQIYSLPASPEIFARSVSAMQANWAEAKRVQGHPITDDRFELLQPAYLTGRTLADASAPPANPAPASPTDIAPIMERAHRRVLDMIAQGRVARTRRIGEGSAA